MIRLRHPNGTTTMPIVEGDTSLGDFVRFVEEKVGGSSGNGPQGFQWSVKTGYPPRIISLQGVPHDTLLAKPPLNIRKGEQVLLAPVNHDSDSQQSGSSHLETVAAISSNPSGAAAASDAKFAFRSGPTESTSILTAARPPKKGKTSASTAAALAAYQASRNDRISDFSRPVAGPASRQAASATISSTPPRPIPLSSSASSEYSDSYLHLYTIPDDNSCLFTSISLIFHQSLDATDVNSMRRVVYNEILADSRLPASDQQFPEHILGSSPSTYAMKMAQPSTWGGAIELSLFSRHFKTKIVAIDVVSGISHVFGEVEDWQNIAYLVYSGIHYDALLVSPFAEPVTQESLHFSTTLFPSPSALADLVEGAAAIMSEQLRREKRFTDTANFTLRCGQCGQGLKGEVEAREHAKQSGHTSFQEY